MEDVFKTTKVKSLPVNLTTEEIDQFGRENARQVEALMNAEEAKKAAMKEHKEIVEGFKCRVRHLTGCVNSGIEWREIPIYETMDRRSGMVRVYRTDTGDQIDTRKMSDDEKQMRFGDE